MSFAPMEIPKKLYSYIIVLFLVTLFLRIVLVGYYNNNFGGIESNVVYGIQRILLGQSLYQDPAAGTYAVMQYTPVYYCFTAGIARLIGINGLEVQGIYMLCRILALVCNMLTVIVATMIIRHYRWSWQQSIIYSLPLLLVLTSHYYTRGDSLHLLFFISAIYACTLFLKRNKLPYIFIASMLSAFCFMTKQSGILVIGITVFSLLFMERKYLAALLYTTSTLIFAYLITLLSIGNNWHGLYQNAWLGLKNGTDFSFLYRIFINQFFMDMVPFYLLGGIMVYFSLKEIKEKPYKVLATSIIFSWVFAVITGLKHGSSNNYFVEFMVLVIIALPDLFQQTSSKKVLFRPFGNTLTTHRFACIALFILVTSKTTGFVTAVCFDKSIKNMRIEYINEETLYAYFTKGLGIQKGEHILFTERNFLDNIFIEYAIMPTKDVVSETYLANPATFNYSSFIAGMNDGLIKYIVTSKNNKDLNRWNKEIPFMLLDKNRFIWIKDTVGYSIYVYHPGLFQ